MAMVMTKKMMGRLMMIRRKKRPNRWSDDERKV